MKKMLVSVLLSSTIALSFGTIAAETYTSDATHTFVSFEYSHLGFSTQRSRFDKVDATVTLDREHKTGSIDVKIDPKSVNTGSEKFNQHLQSDEFFNVAQFPTATFKSTKVIFTGDNPSQVEGNLTLKGITKPVTLTVTNIVCKAHPMMKKEFCGANATAQIKRSDFDLGKFAPYVSDETSLIIAIEAGKN